MRLSRKDEQRIDEIASEARTARLRGEPFLSTILPALGELLHAEIPLAYGLRAAESGPRVDFLFWRPHATAALARDVLDSTLTVAPGGSVAYQPLRPEGWQQNSVVGLDTLRSRYPQALLYARWSQVGLSTMDQLRVLLCEEGTMLAWVGVYRPLTEPFAERERLILRRLVEPMLRRVRLDSALEGAGAARATLEAVLENLSRPAWVVDRKGRVQFANSLARDREPLDGMARHALAGGLGWLVTGPAPGGRKGVDVGAARDRWQLTRRETEVLEQIVLGRSNRAIAARLCCGERTVEVHVMRLLAKSGTGNRSSLAAKVWLEGGEQNGRWRV